MDELPYPQYSTYEAFQVSNIFTDEFAFRIFNLSI